jgi:hypothetical protein
MKKSCYSEAQIVSVLREAESGVPVSELCRTHGMVIPPFLMGSSRRIQAAVFSFIAGVMPPYLRKAKSVEELLPWLYLKGILQRSTGFACGPRC